MTDAIDRLCELLVERDVEYKVTAYPNGTSVTWEDRQGIGWIAYEHDGRLDAIPLADYTPEQAMEATIGRSCASCPEMDNPDSYIAHLQSALKWHDEHVPRPTNPRNTCVVLQGEKPPEEVMFVREGGGVTHYLPEDAGTCEWCKDGKTFDKQTVMMTNHGWQRIRHCPECGARIGRDR